MKLIIAFLFAIMLFTVNSFAINSQEIENKVNKLLQKNEITALSNELVQNNANSTEDLLIKLSVFSRAGHRQRFNQTLDKIGNIYSSSANQKLILSTVRAHLGTDDLESLKIFYEKIIVNGDYRVVSLVNLWREKDKNELEKWLENRGGKSTVWWYELFKLKQSRINSAESINEPEHRVHVNMKRNVSAESIVELEKKIRVNPNNYELVERYLRVFRSTIHRSIGGSVNHYSEDILWLADVFKPESASDAYRFAMAIIHPDIKVAEKFFKKSLTIPFTEKDAKWMMQEFLTPIKVDLEKQLRYRTKKAILDIYGQSKQTQLAQSLKKELSEMDTSNIDTRRQHLFSGYIEEILKYNYTPEQRKRQAVFNAFFQNLSQQISKHEKHKEYELAWQKYLKALNKFEYRPKDSWERLRILSELASFGEKHKKAETETLLKKEIETAEAANDGRYIFSLVRNVDDDFEELVEKLFINTSLLPDVFSNIEMWGYFERYLIESTIENEKWDKQIRESVCDAMVVLAMQKPTSRSFYLAKSLEESYPKKAVKLLENLLQILPDKYVTLNEDDKGYLIPSESAKNINKGDVETNLINAYITSGEWNKAEKLYFTAGKIWNKTLGRMAVLAANKGDIKNAVRLWKLNTNFDRRGLTELKELAKTEAKPLLQNFYLDMKKKDSLTNIPEKALAILK